MKMIEERNVMNPYGKLYMFLHLVLLKGKSIPVTGHGGP
jgi:hypothetical protein